MYAARIRGYELYSREWPRHRSVSSLIFIFGSFLTRKETALRGNVPIAGKAISSNRGAELSNEEAGRRPSSAKGGPEAAVTKGPRLTSRPPEANNIQLA